MNLQGPTNYKGDEDFEMFLMKHETPLTVWDIKSYLLGLVIGLEAVSPAWAVEEILLVGTESEIRLKDEAALGEFMQKIMELWNHLTGFQSGMHTPKLAPLPKNMKEVDYLIAMNIKSSEIGGFITGLYESSSLDIPKENKKFYKAVEDLEDLAEDLEEDLEFGDPTDKEFQQSVLNFYSTADEIFERCFRVIAQSLYKYRLGN